MQVLSVSVTTQLFTLSYVFYIDNSSFHSLNLKIILSINNIKINTFLGKGAHLNPAFPFFALPDEGEEDEEHFKLEKQKEITNSFYLVLTHYF